MFRSCSINSYGFAHLILIAGIVLLMIVVSGGTFVATKAYLKSGTSEKNITEIKDIPESIPLPTPKGTPIPTILLSTPIASSLPTPSPLIKTLPAGTTLPVPNPTPKPLKIDRSNTVDQMVESDFSCNTDSDCSIKMTYTCCGGEPLCMNRKSKVSSDNAVKKWCQETRALSSCGFQEIDDCKCFKKKCVGGYQGQYNTYYYEY